MGNSTTRRGTLGRIGVTARALTGAAAVGALGGCAVPGPPAASKTLNGSVEFWTNPGYAYKDHISQKLVEEFQQANPGVTIVWSDAAIAGTNHATKLNTQVGTGLRAAGSGGSSARPRRGRSAL